MVARELRDLLWADGGDGAGEGVAEDDRIGEWEDGNVLGLGLSALREREVFLTRIWCRCGGDWRFWAGRRAARFVFDIFGSAGRAWTKER